MYYGRTNSRVGGGSTPQMQTQAKEVKATSFPVQVIPDEGYYLTSAKVTAPDNLAAGNIKKDVTIAGVTGTYEGSASTLGTADIKPTAFPTVKNASDDGVDGYSTVTVRAPDNLVAGNIKKDVVIAGVTGTYEGSGSGGSDPEAEFFKALVKTSDLYHPVNAPAGLIKPGTITHWPTNVYVGPDGLDLSNITPPVASNSVTMEYLNQFYMMDSTYRPGGVIKFGNVRIVMPHSKLVGLPDGEWTMYIDTFKDCSFSTDIVITEAHVPSGAILGNALADIKKFSWDSIFTYIPLTLTLPANITSIEGYASVSGTNSAKLNLVMLATTPPTVQASYSIQYLNSITVPAGTLEAYQTATNWSQFADIMVEATTETTEA